MNHAIITHTFNGIEETTEVEDLRLDRFHARIVGTVRGITDAGSVVTKVSISDGI
jgi:hypothetical protein